MCIQNSIASQYRDMSTKVNKSKKNKINHNRPENIKNKNKTKQAQLRDLGFLLTLACFTMNLSKEDIVS